jgi:hypothetical protein
MLFGCDRLILQTSIPAENVPGHRLSENSMNENEPLTFCAAFFPFKFYRLSTIQEILK